MEISKLAAMVDGVVEGDGSIDIEDMSGIDDAETGDMTFAVDEARLAAAEKSAASCIYFSRSYITTLSSLSGGL